MQKSQGGFTIIETMLFLAVSGLVLSVVLIGVGAGVARERYRDAVNSYVDYWQGSYNSVINVRNSRTATDICDAGTGAAGTSGDCTVIGRIIRSSVDGKTVTSTEVYSTVDATTLPKNSTDTDKQVLASAGLIEGESSSTYNVSWDTSVTNAANGKGAQFSVLIVRMPTNGQVRTYISTAPNKTPIQMVDGNAALETADFVMCIDKSGFVNSPTLGAKIALDAVNSSGVTFVGDDAGC